MSKNLRFFTSLIFLILFPGRYLFAFSEKDILSPVAGVWNNIQPLVLDNSEGDELYYSLTGSDPLDSGFAYDGPVVIDQTGDVRVQIACISPDGRRSDFLVEYTVQTDLYPTSNPETSALLQGIILNPIRKYISGDSFFIPQEFLFSLSNKRKPYEKGTVLTLSKKNTLDRYVPVTMTNDSYRYHFVIHVVPVGFEKTDLADIPFSIIDWRSFRYTGTGFIYQIDDGFWSASRESIPIDTSIPHVIRFQSLDYDNANPVKAYLLPPKPVIQLGLDSSGIAALSTEQKSYGGYEYSLGAAQRPGFSGNSSVAITDKLCVDIFDGDEISEQLTVGVYFDGFFLGNIKADCPVDKMAPEKPIIISSASEKFSHSRATLNILTDPGNSVYYSVSKPYEADVSLSGVKDSFFDAIADGDFSFYDGSPFELRSLSDKATFYKVKAFAVDRAGNRSASSEYNVVIDEYNFYLNAELAYEGLSDGSYDKPFRTLEEAVLSMNTMKQSRLHVLTSVFVDESVKIKSDCVILGNQSHLTFRNGACLSFEEGSNVEILKCIIERDSSALQKSAFESESFVYAKNAVVDFKNCELVGVFSGRGILLDSDSSTLHFVNTGLTAQGKSWATDISADKSELYAQNCRFTSSAQNCINISISSSKADMASSVFTILGKLGRNIELVKSSAALKGNSLTSTFEDSNRHIEPVWYDKDSVILEDKENSYAYGRP